MIARNVLRGLYSNGLDISVRGGSLQLRTPDGQVPPNLVDQLRAHKTEILAIFEAQAAALAAIRQRDPTIMAETVVIETLWGRLRIAPEISRAAASWGYDKTDNDILVITWRELCADPEGTLAHVRTVLTAALMMDGRIIRSQADGPIALPDGLAL